MGILQVRESAETRAHRAEITHTLIDNIWYAHPRVTAYVIYAYVRLMKRRLISLRAYLADIIK